MSPNSSPFVLNRRAKYKIADKLRHAEAAISSGWIRPTGRERGIPATNIRRWVSQSAKLREYKDRIEPRNENTNKQGESLKYKLKGSGNTPAFGPAVDQGLLDFYHRIRADHFVLTTRMLLLEWKRIDPTSYNALTPNASRLRMYRWIRRHQLAFRRSTHKAQQKHTALDKMEHFIEYVDSIRTRYNITDDRTANFDETNMPFGVEFKRTIAGKGSRSVPVISPTHSGRLTAMLGCTAGGEFMTPYIIFVGSSSERNGKIIRECGEPKKYGLADDMFYNVQKKGWMDERCMLDFIERVWKPFTDTKRDEDGNRLMTMLILDEAKAHMTSEVRRTLAELNTFVAVIPGGYTSKLQPMDVGLNKPLKDYVRYEVEAFMMENPPGTKPNRKFVTDWISKAWAKLKEHPSIVLNT